MDCHLLDLLLVTTSPKRHNEPESTQQQQPSKDKNNNKKSDNNEFKETITPPCDPGLMSQQRRCNRLTTTVNNNNNNSGRTTRKSKKTSSSTTVTSDPICTTASSVTIESQSSTTVSSISERARTVTTANRPVTTTTASTIAAATTTTTVSTRSSTRSAILAAAAAAKPVNFRASPRRTSSRTNNKTNSPLQQQPCSVVITRKQDTAKHSKRKRGAVLTGNSSSGVRPSDSRDQDSYPRTKNISVAEKKVEIESKSTRRPERNSIAVVIAPPKESSDQVSTFDSSVPPSSVALAVAPITPRTTEGNYSASNSNKNRHAEITSVSSGTESQTASPPTSEAASTTITTASNTASTTAKDNKTGSSGSNVNKESGSSPREGDPSRESFSKTQQKLVVPEGTDQGGDESVSLSSRPSSDKTSESLLLLLPNFNSEVEQKKQQQQLPMNKSKEEEGEEVKEKEENKEVLESTTVPSPSSASTISLPPTQEGELNQPAAAATDNTTTTTTTTTITTITTDSAVGSIYSGTDENSVSLKNKIVSHPGLNTVVPYCKSPSCTSSTTTTNASSLNAPSSSSSSSSTTTTTPQSSSSASSLLVDRNEQPLKLSVTSAKHGSVCLKETPPAAKSTAQNSDATTTTANSSEAIIVQERKTGSVTDTMCGPSEDKIMPNSSGEPSGSATVEKNVDSTTNDTRSTPNLETTTATAKSPATLTITQTLSSLSHSFTTSTATTKAMATKLNYKSTSHVKSLMAPKVGPTLEKEEQAIAAPSNDKNPSIVTTSSQSLHVSSLSSSSLPLRTSSSSISLLPSSPSPAPSTSPPLVSMPAILLTEGHKVVNCTTALQSALSKGSYMVTDTKTLKRTSTTTKATSNEGSTVFGCNINHNGSDDSASSQSPPNLGVDSPDSFVALPQTGFESSEFEEATEDSNSNNSGHVGVNSSVFNLKVNKNSDCAFDDNVLERRCASLISENICDMKYDRKKSLPKVYYNDDSNGTSSKDFRFGSNVYRNIYGPFDNGYDCTFSVQNKDIDHLLETSNSKIGSTSSGFVSDVLRCTTAIADDHSYCSWSVSKTQDTESLLRDAHPCDDEISDSSSLDDIPDQQESLSFLAPNLRIKSPKAKMSSGGAEKNHKMNRSSSSSTPSNSNTFTLKPASKFLVDLHSSGHDLNTQAYHTFDQKLEDDRKVNGLSTPVKFYDNNSGSITSPKITPLKSPGSLGGRGSLQASPKIGRFRIGTFGSISNMDWDENSNTSSSVGSVTLSDKSREKFTYRRKVDFTDKTDKSLMSLGEHSQKSEGRHHTGDGSGRNSSIASMVHILHDHDYCMRTTISPLKSELAKELLSGTQLGSCSSKYSNINSSKGSNSSSNSQTYSSSSSSCSPHSTSYTGITPLSTPSSSTEAKCSRKSRNNSTSKFMDGSETLQESSLVEKTEEAGKLSDPNCDAARSNESKLKITGSFKNDYVYFLNKTTRSRRRISHEVIPDKNQARNYSDIVIPHLTDADIEALKRKRSQSNTLPVWKSSQDPSDLEADNRLMSTVLDIDNLCPDPDGENVLPGLIDSTVVPDNLAANPEQYLTPEEMDILFNAVKEVESTNFKALDEIQKTMGSYGDESPASILHEDQMNPCLADVGDHKDLTDKSDVSTIASPQTAGIPVSQWSGCNSPVDNLTKPEVLTTDSHLLDLENIPIGDINPIIGTGTDKFKDTSLSCTSGSGLPPTDLNTLCANNSNSSLTDENISSLDKFDLLNNSDLFPEPSVADTSNEGNAPWIVTVTMFWNDLPAIMMDNQPYIRLVDIHKQILPAKDTGILKKRCQLLGLEVQNCTEFQRYFLVQYGRAYNSKSTLVISKDDAKILIGYYVNPPTRIPKGEGCEDEPSSPGKRITKTNGSLVGRIKKHGRLIGSRKHSMHKIRNTENKDKINSEKPETGLEQQQQQPAQQQQQQLSQEEQQQQHQVQQSSSPAELTARPRQLKRKKERLVHSASINGKARLRHKKINFLNLIRGETGTSSTTTPSSPATATIASSSSETLSVVDLVNTVGVDPDNDTSVEKSMALLTSGKHSVAKCKTGLKNRIPSSQKVTGSREQDIGALENSKLKECNGRVGLLPVAHDPTTVRGGNQKKKQRNTDPFSTVSSKLPSASKWKNSRNSQGIVGHPKSGHLKAKLKSKGAAASAATNGDTSLITDKMQSLCPALLVYHEDAVPQADQNLCMQPGKLYLGLYSAKNAKCIKCTTCAKVFSVDEFLQHQHLNPNTNSKLVVVSSDQSLRFRDGGNKEHQLLWKNFMVKRELFEFEGHEGSRLLSPLLRTAGVGAKGPVSSSSPAAPAVLNSPTTEHNGGNQKSSSTYRVSSRKRKQKQFYPIENYDFKNLPRSVGHGKDSTLDQFGQWGGKARGANSQSNVGCSPSKKALTTLPVSGTFPSYGVNVASSTRSHNNKSGESLSENVVTLTNEPELLSFTALENDEYN